VVTKLRVSCGETFGAEILVRAKVLGLKVSEVFYSSPRRRRSPRIGGSLRANVRIVLALVKSTVLFLYLSLKRASA